MRSCTGYVAYDKQDEAKPNPLTVLSINTAHLPENPLIKFVSKIIGYFKTQNTAQALGDNETRAKNISAIILALPHLNIVALQEVWSPKIAQIYQDKLKKKFPYIISGIGSGKRCPVSILRSGLMLCADKEMTLLEQETFPNGMCIEEYFGEKGFIAAAIEIEDKILVVINTHLHADTADTGILHKVQDWFFGNSQIRRNEQMSLIKKYIDEQRKTLTKQFPEREILFLLMGDFNVALDDELTMHSLNYDRRTDSYVVQNPEQLDLFRMFVPNIPENFVKIVPGRPVDEATAAKIDRGELVEGTYHNKGDHQDGEILDFAGLSRGENNTSYKSISYIIPMKYKNIRQTDHDGRINQFDFTQPIAGPETKDILESLQATGKRIEFQNPGRGCLTRVWARLWGCSSKQRGRENYDLAMRNSNVAALR